MRAKELLSELTLLDEHLDREIGNLTDHSARATQDSVFVCIKGANVDGHSFAGAAYENGCRIFLAEHPLPLPADATVILTSRVRAACAELACKFYGHPSRDLQVIGITGTKGKTTVSLMLTHILNQNSIPTGYIGTNGIAFASQWRSSANTTPDAITLQKTLAEMRDAGMRAVVIEVSSQSLMQERVAGISFDTVLFTNLFPDHIGIHEHPSFEHYRDSKKRLFVEFGATRMICNADDPTAKLMESAASAVSSFTCSIKQTSTDFFAEEISYQTQRNMLSTCFTRVDRDGIRIPCSVPLLGDVNVDNALLALACAEKSFGISPKNAANALPSLRIAGRSEIFSLPNGACVVIDYAHNGDSLRQLLTALRLYGPARILCLFGSVGERTQGRRAELGLAASELADYCILTSDNPGKEDPEKILCEIECAVLGSSVPYVKIVDREAAILHGLSQTKDGDVLVLAGKGHETYQLVGRERIPFCERDIIERAVSNQLIVV